MTGRIACNNGLTRESNAETIRLGFAVHNDGRITENCGRIEKRIDGKGSIERKNVTP